MDNIRYSVISWNVRFPTDRAWRKKYNVPYNSKAHLESNFLDQLFDIEEDKLFEELLNEEQYIPNAGDWLKTDKPKTQEDEISSLREEFKDLDLEDDR